VRRRRLFASLALLGSAGCLSYPANPEFLRGSTDPASLYADNHRDGAYFLPWMPYTPTPGRVARLALTRNPFDRRRPPQIPVVANDGSELSTVQGSSKITWVGHATVAIHDGPDVVLTDPNFARRMLVFRRHTPPGIPIEAVPDHAMGIISHNHNDHLDAGSVDALPASMHWFVPSGLAEWFRKRGRPNVVELGWWQSARHGRWTITCLPAQHWSRRLGMGTNRTLWCSWMIESDEKRYFFAGDTGYFHGFREYGRKYAPIDVAILPIGAYEPRWFMHPQHVSPAEAYQAFQDLGARYMVPMHWGTFDLAHEPLDRPPAELREAIDAAGGDHERVRILAIGEGWHVP